jgi:hypothetical protein
MMLLIWAPAFAGMTALDVVLPSPPTALSLSDRSLAVANDNRPDRRFRLIPADGDRFENGLQLGR